MRNSSEIYTRLVETLDAYSAGLNTYTESQFLSKANDETWSLAEMYKHTMTAGQKFFLANTKRCLEKRNGQEGGELNERGKPLIALGEFPDIKIKVPEAVKSVILTRPMAEYNTDIEAIRSSAAAMVDAINNDEGTYKIAHPVFGFMNAHEWFLNLEMHTRHHLRQKQNLEALANV